LLRRIEAPGAFTLRFRVRLSTPGAVLIQRNELFRSVSVPAGMHAVELVETPAAQVVRVDGHPAGRWTPLIDHRGGAVGLGVPAGGEAWFDDVAVEPR
jgi:hypothetical protein